MQNDRISVKIWIPIVIIAAAIVGYLVWSRSRPIAPVQVQPVQNSHTVTIENQIRTAVEAELAKPETSNGSKLISVKIKGNEITLDFNKQIESKGQAVFEDTFQRISNAITNINKGNTSIGYKILIEGQPLNDYLNNQETVNWKTYANTKFGFEFKYPNSWYIVGAASLTNHDAQLLSNYKNADSLDLGSTPADLKSIFFETYKVGNNSTLDDLKPKTGLVSFERFTTIQGLEGRKVVDYLSDAPVGNHTHIFFLKNGLVVSFSLGTGSEDQAKLLEQILSTFKFAK